MFQTDKLPLVVDLDGTLTPTDTLVESVVLLVRTAPWTLLLIPFWLLRGRAFFKAAVAKRCQLDVASLPYRAELLEHLRHVKQQGRRLVLATAAHQSIAARVSDHLDIFDLTLASTDDHNLKGANKLRAIQEQVGLDFVYAGDSVADLPIWRASHAAILVGTPTKLTETVARTVPVELHIPRQPIGLRTWLKAIRVHQWLKNGLLFVPLLTAFAFFDATKLLHVVAGFLAFSLAASATYIVNDLWDLDNDRNHPRKRQRPMASGAIPVIQAVPVAALLLLAGTGLGACISTPFLLVLLTYLGLTSAYSWVIKSYVLLDVITLSVLYTLRILAGSVAAQAPTSSWLLAFSIFIFISLALVKRCAELVSLNLQGNKSSRGRDYRVSDLTVLWPLGVGTAVAAVVVFGLFINAPDTQTRYGTPVLLWATALGLIYWLARLWLKTSRGEMDDDPVVYAIKNRGSRLISLGMLISVLLAYFLQWPIATIR